MIKTKIIVEHIPVILSIAKDSVQNRDEGDAYYKVDSFLMKSFSDKFCQTSMRNLLDYRRGLTCLIGAQIEDGVSQDEDLLRLNKPDQEFLDGLIQIIELNVDSGKLDIPFVAAQMNMSCSTFYRKIKGLTGISGAGFMRKIKLRYSVKLMLEEGYNISEAAYATGFCNVGYFRNCFKVEYGVSPSEYMKQLRFFTKYNLCKNNG